MDAKLLMMAAAGAGGTEPFYDYEIDNSLRSPAGGNPLYRSQTSGSTTTWTFSSWVKLDQAVNHYFFLAGQASPYPYTVARWYADGTIIFVSYPAPGDYFVRSANVLRDSSAWYHFVFVFDTTNGTANDRMRMYVNGERVQLQSSSMPPSSHSGYVNNSSYNFYINSSGYSESTSKYMAEICLVDGTAASPTDFGEDKNGIWVPKDVSGLTFGNNGFYLDFADSSALGNDVSGNNNDFTSSGLAANDQMTDTPTNNFATYNPLSNYPTGGGVTGVLGNGNLQLQGAADNSLTGGVSTLGIAPDTGIYYAEYLMTIDNRNEFGITSWISSHANGSGNDQATYGYYLFAASSTGTSTIYELAVSSQTGLTDITAGDIVGIVYDSDNLTLDFYINNAQVGTTVSVSSQTYQFFGDGYGVSPRVLNKANFGQDSSFGGSKTAQNNPDTNSIGDFYYTRASVEGAKALCTANLPEPTIGPNSATLTSEVFAAVLYTGNGTAIGSGGKAVTGVGFQPDMVWIKNRDAADQWMVFDSVRGVTKYLSIDGTDIEVTDTESLSTFDADGFTLGNNVAVNTNTEDYVAYCFKITAGFFDIQGYTGNGLAGRTVSHDLGVAPNFFTCKRRTTDNRNWRTYVSSLPVADPETDYMNLDETGAAADYNLAWNDTAPTSSVITLGTDSAVNTSSEDYVTYLFADVEGFCKIGYYEGNGNADGSFEYLGFSPEFHLVKRTDAVAAWPLYDTARNPYNGAGTYFYADATYGDLGDGTVLVSDFISNGNKVRHTSTYHNASGGDYITLSIGTSFKYSNAK
jgi:hypothetical protein